MAQQPCGEGIPLAGLATPTRNRYFYGKLLTEFHFELEQSYNNRKRWLLNRLATGSGVLCGLAVAPTNNGQLLQVASGVALDRLGREIVVPTPSRTFDPREVTDDCGNPARRIEGEGVVTLCLAYRECEGEPVPVLVGECETERGCAPSTVFERYAVLVRDGAPDPVEPSCGLAEDFAALGVEKEALEQLHPALAGRVTRTCPTAEGPSCVVLAKVNLPADPKQPILQNNIDVSVRPVVYGNDLLFELLVCLAQRVEKCCRTQILRYLSGDGQQGPTGEVLKGGLAVEVVDGQGRPVPDEEVIFHVRAGGGSVGNGIRRGHQFPVHTNRQGRAEVHWKLGAAPGLNTVEASIPSGSRVHFHALAVEPKVVLPKIAAFWPANAAVLDPDNQDQRLREQYRIWIERPRLEITFDREMEEDRLARPEAWLRLWGLLARWADGSARPPLDQHTEGTAPGFDLRRLELRYQGRSTHPVLGAPGFTAVYTLEGVDGESLRGAGYLVQVHADGDNIVDTGKPALLLDADFAGTRLTSPGLLDDIWNGPDSQSYSLDPRTLLIDTGARLPSGDDRPGGIFHSWFAVD